MNIKNNHLVIMAGGVGSRFWPMSTPDYPKQFIDVLGCGRTLIQLTADRFQGICPPENIWVVTSEKYADTVKEQLPDIADDHILREPCRRNTAPCIAYVSWKIKARNPKANMVVTLSDHIVMNIAEFQRVINSAMNFTADSDAILTLGMKPTRPETATVTLKLISVYLLPPIRRYSGCTLLKRNPIWKQARRYIQKNNFFWNAGIFVWNVNTVVNALRVYQPAISKVFERLLPYYYTDKEQEMIDRNFPLCENISVDYAIMEKADEIFVLPASFGWSDLGTWGSLHENLPKDAHNNTQIGENIKLYETRNCVIHTTQEKRVVVQGLDGYIVAEKNNTLLICRLSEEQRIKEFSAE